MLVIPERRSLPELLDLPHDSYARDELEGALKDLTLVNYCLGNGRAVLKHLAALNAETADKGFTVLDVATGTADIPVAIAKWARKEGIRVGITAVDLDPLIMKHRQEEIRDLSGNHPCRGGRVRPAIREEKFRLRALQQNGAPLFR